MTNSINEIAKRLIALIAEGGAGLAVRLGVSDSGDGPKAEQTLSNSLLLLNALMNFYADPKSEFFPTTISKNICDLLKQAEGAFLGLPVGDQPIAEDAAASVLKLLEDLYVYCLQYGLITYGFTGKIAQEQIDEIHQAQQQAKDASKKMLATIKVYDAKIISKLNQFEESLAESEASFNAKVTEQINNLEPSINSLASILAAAQSNSTDIGNILNLVNEHFTTVGNIRAELGTAATTSTEEFAARKASADAELARIQALSLQVQKLESDVKTMHQSVTDARSKMTDQLTQITSFYGEIEKYRSHITEGGKEAASNLAGWRKNSENLILDLSERTNQVVKTNESLIDQIKGHLRKAIGVSLFTAFDTRRRAVNISSWVWAALLLISVAGTIWFAFWFVGEVAALARIPEHSNDSLLGMAWMLTYSRLLIIAPLVFLIAFTARRYTSERRAEEEWAFKSAISVSLEPFRDLIERMRVDGHETAFVEQLVSEIFDNPTKRLYKMPKNNSDESIPDVFSIIKEALEKIPKQS